MGWNITFVFFLKEDLVGVEQALLHPFTSRKHSIHQFCTSKMGRSGCDIWRGKSLGGMDSEGGADSASCFSPLSMPANWDSIEGVLVLEEASIEESAGLLKERFIDNRPATADRTRSRSMGCGDGDSLSARNPSMRIMGDLCSTACCSSRLRSDEETQRESIESWQVAVELKSEHEESAGEVQRGLVWLM